MGKHYAIPSRVRMVKLLFIWLVHGWHLCILVLGQVKLDEKSNEITAIPELLNVLYLKGCIVTIDAMGCQREIVKQIVEQGGDYVINLKKNQGSLYQRVDELFKQAIKSKFQGFENSEFRLNEQEHGRNETRLCTMLTNVHDLIDLDKKWDKLTSIGMINFMRTSKDKITLETRYFITSLSCEADVLAQIVRGHWKKRKSTTLGFGCSI